VTAKDIYLQAHKQDFCALLQNPQSVFLVGHLNWDGRRGDEREYFCLHEITGVGEKRIKSKNNRKEVRQESEKEIMK